MDPVPVRLATAEGWVPIPGEAGALAGEVVIDRALPAGAEMQFHVHNHGANAWELRSVMVTPVAD